VSRSRDPRTPKKQFPTALRSELEKQIEQGRCAYCRAPAGPDRPLTREHVIPRARGGRRKDVRIIVPACARCNQHRGCRDLIPFLLGRPQRISSFLDYLASLSAESVRQLDARVFAELYASIAILSESLTVGTSWREELGRLCSGRSLHRRRYAARRALGAVAGRVDGLREHSRPGAAPLVSGLALASLPVQIYLDEPLDQLAGRFLAILSILWDVSGEVVEREMSRELCPVVGTSTGGRDDADNLWSGEDSEGIVPLDGWKSRPKRKRLRSDRRHGRNGRVGVARGRAA
jgi:hypothetical protein